MKRILDVLYRITHPSAWVDLMKYDESKDKFLLDVMERGVLMSANEYTTFFNLDGKQYEIWCANFPYCFGYEYRESRGFSSARKFIRDAYPYPGPALMTRVKFRKWLLKTHGIDVKKNDDDRFKGSLIHTKYY